MRTLGVIPARLQSSRLPRKLLLDETGKPLIQYAWEAACRSEALDECIIATDSAEIAEAVRSFGGRCAMTGEHPSGTDRIAEVVRLRDGGDEIIVNVQGDEPEIDPAHIDRLVETLRGVTAEMATLATPIRDAAQRDDCSCTKVVCAADGRALYFSRLPIPFCRDADADALLGDDPPAAVRVASGLDPEHPRPQGHAAPPPAPAGPPWLLHLGLYAYRREFLLRLSEMPPSPLERLEKLEQLRALEAGATIRVAIVEHPSVGIDTPEDYARFVSRQRQRDG